MYRHRDRGFDLDPKLRSRLKSDFVQLVGTKTTSFSNGFESCSNFYYGIVVYSQGLPLTGRTLFRSLTHKFVQCIDFEKKVLTHES